MYKRNILAHRGLWEEKSQQNSLTALTNALKNGFGIETDIRYFFNEGLIISHDPCCFELESYILFEDLLKIYKEIDSKSFLAINIKSDGLHKYIKDLIESYKIKSYFLFDMSIPDLISGKKYSLNQYSRASIFESANLLSEICSGVWIDIYDEKFPSSADLNSLSKVWKNMAFVSPELHGKNYINYWKLIYNFISDSENHIMLCTDKPYEAFNFFNQ